jgi:hypothetical protein
MFNYKSNFIIFSIFSFNADSQINVMSKINFENSSLNSYLKN